MFRALAVLVLLTPLGLQAQSSNDFQEDVAVSYVMIPFTVLGPKGAPVPDLRRQEVTLLVDGRPVASDMFEVSRNAPVSWTILVDGSGSMGLAGKMAAARSAVDALLAARLKGDDFALYVFSAGQARELVPFTQDPAAITRAFNTIKPWGKTAFFDALADMPERSELGNNPSRAIVLLSDGIDNASRLTRQQIAAQLEGVAIPIYALGLREPAEATARKPATPSEELSDLELLDELSQRTGGKMFAGNKPEQMTRSVAIMTNDLRAQYLIGFPPTGKGPVKYRNISLKLSGRIRSVRVRAGYRGTEPPVLSATAASGKNKKTERKKNS